MLDDARPAAGATTSWATLRRVAGRYLRRAPDYVNPNARPSGRVSGRERGLPTPVSRETRRRPWGQGTRNRDVARRPSPRAAAMNPAAGRAGSPASTRRHWTNCGRIRRVCQEAKVRWALLSGGEETDGAVGPVRALGQQPAAVGSCWKRLRLLRAPGGEMGWACALSPTKCTTTVDPAAGDDATHILTASCGYRGGRMPHRGGRHGLLVLASPDDARSGSRCWTGW